MQKKEISFPCSVCKKTACRFIVEPQALLYEGLIMPNGQQHNETLQLDALPLLDKKDFVALSKKFSDFFGESSPRLDAFCEQCSAFYCSEHYEQSTQDYGGLDIGMGYKILTGKCPKGHSHVLGTYDMWKYG